MIKSASVPESSPLLVSTQTNEIAEKAQERRTNTNQFSNSSYRLSREMTTSQIQTRDDEKTQAKWGGVIDTNSCVPGSFIRLITLVSAIIIIPLQLFCDGLI